MEQLRIAIAEDNWFLAEHLRSELVALGHTVVGLARTREELVELVARERPDLAFVDIRLANGSDGLAAARDIQERLTVQRSLPRGILLQPRPKPPDCWDS